jgi:hypothetical protein
MMGTPAVHDDRKVKSLFSEEFRGSTFLRQKQADAFFYNVLEA